LILIDFLKDLFVYIKYKYNEKNYSIGFFCENEFILNYLSPYITTRIKNKKPIVIMSFEKIKYNPNENVFIYILHTNFFRELFFLTLKLKYLYSSTPDLEKTIFKKTKFSKCKYIYIQHSPVSLNLIYRESAFDDFDAIQTISKFQNREIKEIIKKRDLKLKIFKSSYQFIKKNINQPLLTKKYDLLIAPSWNTSFYKLNCHKILHEHLSKNSISYKLRPHPMSFKKREITYDEINNLGIILDNSKLVNLNEFNFLISDWSGIFIEFALVNKRKSFLINTPKKRSDTNYENYNNKPIEITKRELFGKIFNIENLDNLVKEITSQKKTYQYDDNEIVKFTEENFY
tara:strand:- start:34 stop:1065 length:1032 start_codon:yes stop_codon:yes gene_type:complete